MFLSIITILFSFTIISTQTIESVLGGPQGNYSTFLSFLNSTTWSSFLPSNSTIIAPTNAAFNSLTPTVLNLLQTPAFSSLTFSIIAYHIVKGLAIPTGVYPTELNGTNVLVWENKDKYFVNQAQVVLNETFSGGLVYGVDSVLAPTFPFVGSLGNVGGQLGGLGSGLGSVPLIDLGNPLLGAFRPLLGGL